MARLAPKLSSTIRALQSDIAALNAQNARQQAAIDALHAQIKAANTRATEMRARVTVLGWDAIYADNVFGHGMFADPQRRGINLNAIGGRPFSDWNDIASEVVQIRPGDTVLDIGAKEATSRSRRRTQSRRRSSGISSFAD